MPKTPYKLISPQAGRHSEVCDLLAEISPEFVILPDELVKMLGVKDKNGFCEIFKISLNC